MCAAWKRSQLDPGGMAEFVRIPEINLRYDTLVLPDRVSFEDGTLIEPAACSVKAVERARVRPGDIVLIIGLGFMGILNAIVARHYGAKTIIGADKVPYRLQKARELGIDWVVNVAEEKLEEAVAAYTDGVKADIVIVGPGSVPAMKTGIACAGKGGTVLFSGPLRKTRSSTSIPLICISTRYRWYTATPAVQTIHAPRSTLSKPVSSRRKNWLRTAIHWKIRPWGSG